MAIGEAPIKQAVRWIDEQFRENPKASRFELINQACLKFNLSPLDGEFLFRNFAQKPKGDAKK